MYFYNIIDENNKLKLKNSIKILKISKFSIYFRCKKINQHFFKIYTSNLQNITKNNIP